MATHHSSKAPTSTEAPPTKRRDGTDPASAGTTERAAEVGAAAAWRYARLALAALVQPLLSPILLRLPALNAPTRVYLCANMVMYAAFALVFFAGIGHASRSAVDPLLTAPLALTLWGITALLVCAAQLAVLLVARWFVWEIAAILTAMWASLLSMLLWIEALHALFGGLSLASIGAISGAIWWTWVVIVHLILIQYRFVRVPAALPDPHDPQESDPPTPPQPRGRRRGSAPGSVVGSAPTHPTPRTTRDHALSPHRQHTSDEEDERDPILIRLRALAQSHEDDGEHEADDSDRRQAASAGRR